MYYLGLISGTSVDGIDAVILNLDDRKQLVIAAQNTPYPEAIHKAVDEACKLPEPVYEDLVDLDMELGHLFADAANQLIKNSGIAPAQIKAIGSHGQTVHHAPHAQKPYTLQLGNGEVIARETGIRTVYDFRTADINAGGEGAPLVPAFHAWLAKDLAVPVVFLNIGGIANITVLDDKGRAISGYDTGPGNTLMDRWIELHQHKSYDNDGKWAASGKVDISLLNNLLADPYFSISGPKSTGREHFNLNWLEKKLSGHGSKLEPADIQASLLQLSCQSIADAILKLDTPPQSIYACGGGVHNKTLMCCLQDKLPGINVTTTHDLGLDPDWVEAAAFAWLAHETLAGRPGNIPAVTGAASAVVLGKIASA